MTEPGAPPRLDIRSSMRLGLGVIVVFLGGGVAAATYAPIDRGASLSGTVIVEARTRAVQHDRGGILGEVRVAVGAEVKAGDVIATIDSTALVRQIEAVRAQHKVAMRQLELAREEAALIGDLVKRQLTPRSRIIAIERQVTDIEKEVESQLARLALAEEDVRRAEIRAPVGGRILTLSVTGAGAVVQAGQTVAEIVPQQGRLVVEGRLAPSLVDIVKPGLPARVWLTGFAWRETRPLEGRLAWISPDSVEDRRTGVPYFTARIELDPSGDAASPLMSLHPGQRAEVLIVTGSRTLLEQLLDPILRNLNRSFRA